MKSTENSSQLQGKIRSYLPTVDQGIIAIFFNLIKCCIATKLHNLARRIRRRPCSVDNTPMTHSVQKLNLFVTRLGFADVHYERAFQIENRHLTISRRKFVCNLV